MRRHGSLAALLAFLTIMPHAVRAQDGASSSNEPLDGGRVDSVRGAGCCRELELQSRGTGSRRCDGIIRYAPSAGCPTGRAAGRAYGLPRGRRYYNGRYFGPFNSRFVGPQYGYL
jgi:hypothetical protein